MMKWSRDYLIRARGAHVCSERECRIQVLEVSTITTQQWTIPAGSLLTIVLSGSCFLVCGEKETELLTNDEVLLRQGESFGFRVTSEEHPCAIQFVWMPGISGA
ncbi:MAG TPA: hypothetical protein VKP30_10000 [Polyangiaceae bacterium]|nr:hypothetical protein [Polyangiaceae bacterium]